MILLPFDGDISSVNNCEIWTPDSRSRGKVTGKEEKREKGIERKEAMSVRSKECDRRKLNRIPGDGKKDSYDSFSRTTDTRFTSRLIKSGNANIATQKERRNKKASVSFGYNEKDKCCCCCCLR